MATTEKERQEAAKQAQNWRHREAINNAYAALVGQSSVNSFAAFTFEEALDAQIEAIEGESSPIHPNQLDRVQQIRDNLIQTVEEVRQIDPKEFRLPDPDDDVNTPQE